MNENTYRFPEDEANEIDWNQVSSEIGAYLDSDLIARSALKKLVECGCDHRYVVRSLYLFCGLYPEELEILKRELEYRKNKMATTVRILQTLETDINKITEWLAEAGYQCHFTPDLTELHSYADFLDRVGTIVPPLKRANGRDLTSWSW